MTPVLTVYMLLCAAGSPRSGRLVSGGAMLQQSTPVPQHLFSPNADSVTSVERSDGPGWRRPMPRVSSMLFDLEVSRWAVLEMKAQ